MTYKLWVGIVHGDGLAVYRTVSWNLYAHGWGTPAMSGVKVGLDLGWFK